MHVLSSIDTKQMVTVHYNITLLVVERLCLYTCLLFDDALLIVYRVAYGIEIDRQVAIHLSI